MFTRYWRSYPWALQVALFILMIFTLASAGVVIAIYLSPMIFGVPLDIVNGLSAASSRKTVDVAIFYQFIGAVTSFLLPAIIFSYVTHPRPAYYLGLRAPGKKIQLLLVATLIIGFVPIIMEMESLIRMINAGPKIAAMQKQHDDIFSAYMKMPTVFYFVLGLVVMALTPAVAEELVFRGVIMRFVQKRSVGIVTPIFVSSLLFALIHGDAYGFLPLFVAGAMLGTIYYLTRSLWCAMLAHALVNGLQVTMVYLGQNNATIKRIMDNNLIPIYILIPAILLFGVSLYLLWQNRTPLPPNWTNDFNEGQPKPQNTFSAN